MIEDHLIYANGWLSFALLHSLLAREFVKARLKPFFAAYYRLAYNIFAGLHIGAVYILGLLIYYGQPPFERPDWLWPLQWILYGVGWLAMFWALRSYDLGILSGLKQVRDYFNGVLAHDDEPLHFYGLHCWVRHPLYVAGLLILWGRVDDMFSLMTAIWGSLYLYIGSLFEERHLLRLYGDHYATYKSKVPAFIPYKGKVSIKDPEA